VDRFHIILFTALFMDMIQGSLYFLYQPLYTWLKANARNIFDVLISIIARFQKDWGFGRWRLNKDSMYLMYLFAFLLDHGVNSILVFNFRSIPSAIQSQSYAPGITLNSLTFGIFSQGLRGALVILWRGLFSLVRISWRRVDWGLGK